MFLGSDALAVGPFTQQRHLSGGRRLRRHRPQRRAHLRRRRRGRWSAPIVQVSASAALVEKGDYRHFMEKEIHEQPDSVPAHPVGLPRLRERPGQAPAEVDFAAVDRIQIVACGTAYLRRPDRPLRCSRSWPACPCDVEIASEFRYREPALTPGTLAVAVTPVGRDRRHPGRPALVQGAGPDDRRPGQRPPSSMAREAERAVADPRRAGDRRRLDQGLHRPGRGPAGAGRRRRACSAAASTRREEAELVKALLEAPRLIAEALQHGGRPQAPSPTTSPRRTRRALPRPRRDVSRWPWKAR